MPVTGIHGNSLLPSGLPGSGYNKTTDDTADFSEALDQAVKKAQQSQSQNKTAAGNVQEDAKLRAACREMESVFLNMLLKEMRSSVPKESLFSKSSEEETMQSMLDTEMTKNMAKAGGIGLADMIYKQLSKPTVPAAAIKGRAKS